VLPRFALWRHPRGRSRERQDDPGSAPRHGTHRQPLGIPSILPFDVGTPNNGGSVITASGLIFIASATTR